MVEKTRMEMVGEILRSIFDKVEQQGDGYKFMVPVALLEERGLRGVMVPVNHIDPYPVPTKAIAHFAVEQREDVSEIARYAGHIDKNADRENITINSPDDVLDALAAIIGIGIIYHDDKDGDLFRIVQMEGLIAVNPPFAPDRDIVAATFRVEKYRSEVAP